MCLYAASVFLLDLCYILSIKAQSLKYYYKNETSPGFNRTVKPFLFFQSLVRLTISASVLMVYNIKLFKVNMSVQNQLRRSQTSLPHGLG